MITLPEEIINLIFSYIPKAKCYRCCREISMSEEIILYSNYQFCSQECTEYNTY
jgi:hypothetical protein